VQIDASVTGSRERATFNSTAEGTQEDWDRINASQPVFYSQLTDRVLTHLQLLGGDYGGFKVDRLTHSLQTATRAYRADRDDEYVACALLHDIGDTLACYHDPDIGAAIVKPFVNEDQPAFDPTYPTMALGEFEPLLRSLFATPKQTMYRRD
jgi:hypothetical protein